MLISVNALTGMGLSYAVALAEGWVTFPTDSGFGSLTWYKDAERAPHCRHMLIRDWKPAETWQGDEIIDREFISVEFTIAREWCAALRTERPQRLWLPSRRDQDVYVAVGKTRREAAMRAYVAARYGVMVEVPDCVLPDELLAQKAVAA